MSKSDLIEEISRAAKISQKKARTAVDIVFNRTGSAAKGPGYALGTGARRMHFKKKKPFAGAERGSAVPARRDGGSRTRRPAADTPSTGFTIRPSRPRSAAQAGEVAARIRAGAETLPSPSARRASGDILQVVGPEMRAASGRLDARKVAASVGLSLRQIAPLAGVSPQALSTTPDSPRAQVVLRPIAELAAVLNRVMPDRKQAWLQSPNPAFDDVAPVDAIAAGRAEVVLLKVENALAGHPD